jgi:phospholipid/cholesterol/gamma-HCH transport system permease protein
MNESRFSIVWEQDPAGSKAVFTGLLSAETAAAAREPFLRGARETRGLLAVDLSGVEHLDSAGTAVLLEVDRLLRGSGRRLEIRGASPDARGMLSLVDWETLVGLPAPRVRRRGNLLVQLGAAAFHTGAEARHLVAFAGGLAIALVRSLRHRSVRWAEVVRLVEIAGMDAVPIVALISLLLGLIMAFLGALQLRQYGATVYVADGVALAMVRELGPIMTAILVAGRSGSGFAAELGSMTVNDEVNALVTMGFDPLSYLALPRVSAVVIAMPCLAIISSFSGIIGGLAVGLFQLDIPLVQYLNETRDILSVRHILIGLSKSVFFGLFVATVGCYKGLSVQGAEEEVGRAATSAVVQGIFLIVIADALFAVVLAYLPF